MDQIPYTTSLLGGDQGSHPQSIERANHRDEESGPRSLRCGEIERAPRMEPGREHRAIVGPLESMSAEGKR
jgi:hypothetical protein